ncbi:hypothetical protein D9O50_08110 [Oxalobacteraceae bacterium CAVE-383]|nr:hypothetical protein D9O50_08110 [Oxalobacteraceae bacterium CAVE-383]
MISPISNQIPRGDYLAQAVNEHQKYAESQDSKAQVQHAFDVSKDGRAPRTLHADFMAELNAQVLVRINAR